MTTQDQNYQPPPLTQLIFGDGTPKRAFLTALVVGSVLTSINHGDLLLAGALPPIWKILLTYCVPYCVTTWGAVIGKRAQWRKDIDRIADLSFFNFRNAITATYFADEALKVRRTNKNFSNFFPDLGPITDVPFPDVLRQLGVADSQAEEFVTSINTKGFVFIPEIHIRVKGEGRVFSLLSTRTQDDDFSYLTGVQGQFIDRTEEWRQRENTNNRSEITETTV